MRRGSVPATSLDRYTRNVERNKPNKKAGEKRKQPKQKGSQKGSGVGNRAPVTSLDRHTVKPEECRRMQEEVLRKIKQETEHLPRLWTDTLYKKIVRRSPEANQK